MAGQRTALGITTNSAPVPARPDLLWWLWSRNRQDQPQGVYSRQTALSLQALTDVMPSRLHMTVPKTFRRSTAIPKVVALHMADLPPSDIQQIDGVPVTKALRTMTDVLAWSEVPVADLRLAFAGAVQSGKITRTEIAAAKKDPGLSKYTSSGAFRQALEERIKTVSRQEQTDFQRLCRRVAFDFLDPG